MAESEVELVDVTVAPAWADLVRIHEATATIAYADIFDSPFPVDEATARWRSYDGAVTLAVQAAQSVGFAAWSGDLLDALYVLPQCSGQGVGALLLGRVPLEVRRLWVLVLNQRGRWFDERHGWVNTGSIRPAYGPVEEVLYRR